MPQDSQPIILVVDDSAIDLDIICQVLRKNNYYTLQVMSGLDALNILQVQRPDLILLDVDMPAMNGYQLCHKIKAHTELKHIPVIMITSLEDRESIDNAFAAGAEDYNIKPVHYDLLLRRVQTIISKTRYMKELEIAKASGERQAKILMDATADGIFGLDLDGNCIWANNACLHMTGYSDLGEFVGQNMHDLIHHSRSDSSPYPVAECRICKTMTFGESAYVSDEVLWKKDGTKFPVEYRSYPIFSDNEITGAVITFIDITERLKLIDLQSQQEKQAMLTHAGRLATLGEMATGIAHEINQPLAGISYTAAFLNKAFKLKKLDDEDFCDSLKDINHCVQRMSRIIDHIRTFARQDNQDFESYDIHATLEGALTLLGEQLRLHEIEVIKDYDHSLLTIECRPSQLEQVWINHITNAKQAMNPKKTKSGGLNKTLSISTKYDNTNETIDILFIDNGMGMSEEVKTKMFDPFYTTKEIGEGTGLGLSVSYGIISNHNGKYFVDSIEGSGTTIRITLPIK